MIQRVQKFKYQGKQESEIQANVCSIPSSALSREDDKLEALRKCIIS